METNFESKCDILSDLWLNYRDETKFKDFIQYNDIALPLSFMISEEIVQSPGELAVSFVEETFDLLLKATGVKDLGFETLNDILDTVGEEE